MEIQKDELLKMSLEEIVKLTKGDLKKVGEIIEQMNNKDIPSSSSPLVSGAALMNKYFLTPTSDNEIVLNKLNLKKLKTIARRQGLKNYSKYNSKTKSDLVKLILKEELNAVDWHNKLSRISIKKLKSIASILNLNIKRNSKKIDLLNQISDNVNNDNLNTLLNEIEMPSLEEILKEILEKSTQNKTLKELRKLAKEKNIKGYSKMKKAELLQQ
ncbi:hypothetical protein Zmor_006117 [Zophobas morio]|uniref:Rho termination factor-like N-terminal domain-containing protein n=1 Tax=Zophobas morio TaxID=2755281 RepID=A0AA38ML42_9CUCU|nr:hypothetical protein Zmor_006117 [Zophobas morio]